MRLLLICQYNLIWNNLEDQQNARPLAKVNKPQKNIAGKNLPVNVKIKEENVKIKQNEIKTVLKVEKITETINNRSIDCSSDVSVNEEYEDDFEVNILVNIKIKKAGA